MSFHLAIILSLGLFCLGCSKPTGTADQCVSNLSVQEESNQSNNESTLLGSAKIGQQFQPTKDIKASAFAIKAEIPGGSPAFFTVSIYKVGVNDALSDSTAPEKSFNIGPVPANTSKQIIWLSLPETYEFKLEYGLFYLVSIEVSNASIKYSVDSITSKDVLRKGYREYSGGFWSFADTTKSITFGIRGLQDCN